jgi:uncharacterized membrane protein YidH (DUF202 family)
VGFRLASVLLVAAVAALDAAGAHDLAGLALVAAVPAASLAGLTAFADAASEQTLPSWIRAGLGAVALVLVILAAAVRAPLTASEDVPAVAASALAACLAVLALQVLFSAAARVSAGESVRRQLEPE